MCSTLLATMRGMLRLVKRWSGLVRPAAQTKADQQVSLAQYNTYEARLSFSQLLWRVRRGERIVIAHGGHPIAMLVPYEGPRRRHAGVVRAHVVVEPTNGARPAPSTPTRSSPEASS
jgi:antitoxin (DNA-binding transcriptional repressor) of toxin-antitoxin stability system